MASIVWVRLKFWEFRKNKLNMKIAMLAPIAWRTPPGHYGPWELVTSLLTEELVKMGLDVTLFATGNSQTNAKLKSICEEGYAENPETDAKVVECLHISECMERAEDFDVIHNQFDFLPLTYSKLIQTPMVTTIHGFSSPKILPVYRKYNANNHYVSISYANREPALHYAANIYHGIDLQDFHFEPHPSGKFLLFLGRIHPDKGPHEAIQIAKKSGIKLILAGIIQDEVYFENEIKPYLNEKDAEYIGSVGQPYKTELLSNALAMLHPIHFSEPFGLSVVESMACGTPVIAYSKGSMPELIDHGNDGFLVSNVTEAVESVRKIELIERKKCRTKVEQKFTAAVMAGQYLELYQNILQTD